MITAKTSLDAPLQPLMLWLGCPSVGCLSAMHDKVVDLLTCLLDAGDVIEDADFAAMV